jgi:hypothetical protein
MRKNPAVTIERKKTESDNEFLLIPGARWMSEHTNIGEIC